MKKIVLLATLTSVFFIAGCVSNQHQKVALYKQNLQSMTPCPAERPMMCTMEHNPTCGIYQDGSMSPVEYSSGCIACTRQSVAGYIEGPCSNITLNQENAKE